MEKSVKETTTPLQNEVLSSESDSDDEETWEKIKRRRMRAQKSHLEQISKLDIHSIATNIHSKLTPKRKMVKKEKKAPLPPQRRSLRISKTEAEKQASIELMQQQHTASISNPYLNKEVPPEEHKMSPLDSDGDILKDIFLPSNQKVAEPGKESSIDAELESFIKSTHQTVLKGCISQKVVQKRILTMAMSSGSNEKLIAVGDTHGSLGIWNFDQRKSDGGGVYQFSANSASVRCLHFSPRDNRQLYMCGYDGRFRVANLERLIFETCLIDDENSSFACFNFQDACGNMVICGTTNGDIVMKDVRSSKANADFYDAHDRVVKSVSFHPLNPQYFATASNDAKIKVWDVRKLSHNGKLKPVTFASHAKTVNSAFFSPLTGKKLLSTSLDNTIKVFDTIEMNQGILKCLKTASHDNTTGRWLSNFQATWHPKREDLFFVGSMKRPRRIDLFDAHGLKLVYEYEHEGLSTVCSVVRHHPTLNLLAGGNSSGRVHIFDSDAH